MCWWGMTGVSRNEDGCVFVMGEDDGGGMEDQPTSEVVVARGPRADVALRCQN